MSESVLVVPDAALAQIADVDGFTREPGYIAVLRQARFVDRDLAERDETIRQVIPYIVLRSGERLFSYLRTGNGKEARLHGRRSIGVGGHVNPSDLGDGFETLATDPLAALTEAAYRELREETVGLDRPPFEPIGFIRESGSPVARVHLGLVLQASVDAGAVRLSDEGAMSEAAFLEPAELRRTIDEYEGWSRIVIEHLDRNDRT